MVDCRSTSVCTRVIGESFCSKYTLSLRGCSAQNDHTLEDITDNSNANAIANRKSIWYGARGYRHLLLKFNQENVVPKLGKAQESENITHPLLRRPPSLPPT